MSPERSNSPQDEAILTAKMSVPASPVAGTPIREAQSPISLLLAVAQSQNRNGDDDLTNLAWLHERDLLKGMNINPSPASSVNSTPVKYAALLTDQLPTSDYVDDSSVSAADSSSSSLNSPIPYSNGNNTGQRNKHPHNIPYDPLIHTNNKPPYSFSCLIFMAIEDCLQKALPVKEIYAWILDHFPYFKNAPTGWKNSVRHNLSLNKCFQKVEKAPNLGKGSLWTVDQQYKPNLIQALTRSPFHPCSTLDPSLYVNGSSSSIISGGSSSSSSNSRNPVASGERHGFTRLPNPDLYPYLSRKLASASTELGVKSEDVSDESLDAADAAAVMLSLKNGPRYRLKKDKGAFQIITTSPSQDHTYSAAELARFDSDDDGETMKKITKSQTRRKIDFETEEEEERKIKEGAETLLNLAGISTLARKRKASGGGESSHGKKTTHYDVNENEEDGDEIGDDYNCNRRRPTPFKPRLLRTKKKDGRVNNNSKIIIANNNNDEWVKHRRELDINQHR